MRAIDFLSREERRRVESAIRAAERSTSGEIRIHIERKCDADPKERALRTFRVLRMARTAARNGVLIYVAYNTRKFAVLGDKGINEAVPHGFWNDVCDLLGASFSAGRYAEGLEKAVVLIGEKLKMYFPYQADDVNELPDEISFHENDGED